MAYPILWIVSPSSCMFSRLMSRCSSSSTLKKFFWVCFERASTRLVLGVYFLDERILYYELKSLLMLSLESNFVKDLGAS